MDNGSLGSGLNVSADGFGSRTTLRVILKELCTWSQHLLRCSRSRLWSLCSCGHNSKANHYRNCYTSWVLKMMITHEFWLLCRRLIGMGNLEVVRTCQACVAGSESQSGGCKGGCSLENYWFACWVSKLPLVPLCRVCRLVRGWESSISTR